MINTSPPPAPLAAVPAPRAAAEQIDSAMAARNSRDGRGAGVKPAGQAQTFAVWLRQFRADDTPVGDLARDVAADRRRHSANSRTLTGWRRHLRTHGAGPRALRALDTAWAAYAIASRLGDREQPPTSGRRSVDVLSYARINQPVDKGGA